MKRLLFMVLLLSALCIPVSAQTGLSLGRLFDGTYTSDPSVTQTFMSGAGKFLKTHHLDVFATFKAPASKYSAIVEKYIKNDAAKAIGKNVRYKNGTLFFALYTLSPVTVDGRKRNRFIYYYNAAAGSVKMVMMIYMEGPLDEDEANKLILDLKYNTI